MSSFSDPDTRYQIIKSETPVSVDGFAMGEPTGEVRCCECGASHLNIDEIPHAEDCPQRFVRSDWWRAHVLDD
ncbi:hypothetical protein [Halocalculus aciditolerans]|uniref:Uncharacterized protein n=1 Tax=Halocalculus aciditolerans TaxID=1383812 RepID=A0A830FI79_9EURY|nr:hypothetical protein [Halocalculus aciditolerans]GGL55271.1 hypothetical protein GCM10009039_11760 [Halocalculus aciditolerans]